MRDEEGQRQIHGWMPHREAGRAEPERRAENQGAEASHKQGEESFEKKWRLTLAEALGCRQSDTTSR